MTYCCGILVRDGLVMFADTRTNAGVDNISTFRKLHVFRASGRAHHGDRVGRQSVDQPVGRQHAARGLGKPGDRRDRDADERADHVPGRAARRVAPSARFTIDEGEALEASDVKFDVSFLLGGQIKGERPRLFMLYSAGNFIECTPGHALSADRRAQIRQAGARSRDHLRHRPLRCAQGRAGLGRFHHALESRVSACRSTCWSPGATPATRELNYRIEPGEPYFHDLRERWSAALRAAHTGNPTPALQKRQIDWT